LHASLFHTYVASQLQQLTWATLIHCRCLITYPMMFELKNPVNSAKTHCGVMEFTAPEGIAYLPYWMMAGLCLQNGAIVDIKSATLRKGTYVKLQPHKTKFTTLSNPRIVLEKALRSFSCLTKGGTISIKHGTQTFLMDVLETKPGLSPPAHLSPKSNTNMQLFQAMPLPSSTQM
jgi:hypothetical protein